MRKQLALELLKKIGNAIVIFGGLLAILYIVERLCPSQAGHLLEFSKLPFIIGIPASVIGVAYVLTITNPKNYMGFYAGIVMALLLAYKFFLIGQIDQAILYLCIFMPFQIRSLVGWRKNTLHPTNEQAALRPRYLDNKGLVLELCALVALIILDFVLMRVVLHKHDPFIIQLMSGLVIGSSFLANLLMIWQKNDAWMWWVVYSITGVVLFILIFDPFLIVLNGMFLLINGSAHIAWIKMTQPEDFGWAKPIFRSKL